MKQVLIHFPEGLLEQMDMLVPRLYPNRAELVRDACWKLVESYKIPKGRATG